MKTLVDRILHLNPCGDAADWLRNYTDPERAWLKCDRGDWMLWLLGTQAGPPWGSRRKKLVLTACDCAELALLHVDDPQVRKCLETTRAWASGKATRKQLREAKHAADLAFAQSFLAGTAFYRHASSSAAILSAAEVAFTAVHSSECDYSVTEVISRAAPKNQLPQCADIVRKHYPKPPKIARPK